MSHLRLNVETSLRVNEDGQLVVGLRITGSDPNLGLSIVEEGQLIEHPRTRAESREFALQVLYQQGKEVEEAALALAMGRVVVRPPPKESSGT